MRVLMSGASGLIGSALTSYLTSRGDEVLRLVRREVQSEDEREWDPEQNRIAHDACEGIDVVVHLAGENVADGRWSRAKQRRIRESRVVGTRLIASCICRAERPPRKLVSASAVGFYGDRGDQILDEASSRGDGFLAEVAAEWEEAAMQAASESTEVVAARFGVVLTSKGGAFAKMLPFFRMGMGGPIGNGKQYVSWISLTDAVRALVFLIDTEVQEIANLTAPNPVTNKAFASALGAALQRPSVCRVPKAVVRAALGEMAEEILLASARVHPTVLQQMGFDFEHSSIEQFFSAELHNTNAEAKRGD